MCRDVENRIDEQVKSADGRLEHCKGVVAKRVASLMEQLRVAGLWPVATTNKPLATLIASLEHLRLHDLADISNGSCPGPRCVRNEKMLSNFKSSVVPVIRGMVGDISIKKERR